MHTTPTISVVVAEDGSFELLVAGAKGQSCVDLTKKLEQALGEVAGRQLTTDYYAKPVVTTATAKGSG